MAGLPPELVLSDENHAKHFICGVCQCLCEDQASVTPCTHVFCRGCLEEWLERSIAHTPGHKCPACNTAIDPAIGVRPLRQANPLAWRVLSSVQVRCPLHEQGCTWTGDYGSLQAHLISSTEHSADGVADAVTTTTAAATAFARKESPSSSPPASSPSSSSSSSFPPSSLPTPSSSYSPSFSLSSLPTAAATTPRSPAAPGNSTRAQHDGGASSTSSTTESSSSSSSSARANALALKEQANAKFTARSFPDALGLYTKAIQVDGTIAEIYSNRAATYLELGQPEAALADAQTALRLDESYAKAYGRRAKAQLELGDFGHAVAGLEAGQQLLAAGSDQRGQNLISQLLIRARDLHYRATEGESMLLDGRVAEARATFSKLLLETNAVSVKLLAAKAELALGIVDRAQRITLQVIRHHPQEVMGYALRGQSFFLAGALGDAAQLFKHALRLDPDNTEARQTFKHARQATRAIEAADALNKARDFPAAIEAYTDALQVSALPPHAPLLARLRTSLANALHRTGDHEGALRECALALAAQGDFRDAWLGKCNALQALDRHQEAARDMDALMKSWGQNDSVIRHRYERAVFEVRKARRPDYYALLGVPRVASESEIKVAYKRKARELHPDKQPEKKRSAAEEAFKLLGEGFEVLTDPYQRPLYDEGYDKEAIVERVAAAKRAAHNHSGHGHHH